MRIVAPKLALVRPRVVAGDTGETRPLDEVVAELADEHANGVWRLVGGPGSGRSTALAHLAAVFDSEDRLLFLDEPSPQELAQCPPRAIVIASLPRAKDQPNAELAMADWGRDELIEYVLRKNRAACGSVIGRLGEAVHWNWTPLLAHIVIERFIEDQSAADPTAVLFDYVRSQFSDARQFQAACQFCLAVATGSSKDLSRAVAEIKKWDRQDSPANLLFLDERVRTCLAADLLVASLSSRKPMREFERRLPLELVEQVGRRCRDIPKSIRSLCGYLASYRREVMHPMMASIMHVADPEWRPEAGLGRRWNLSGAYLRGAKWPAVKLDEASLQQTDFTGAELRAADLSGAFASGARFADADMSDAHMLSIAASGAHFTGACLRDARLASAKLNQADFTRADLTSAALMHADLRNANLTSACFFRADLTGARLQQAKFTNVNFAFATLSQAALFAADLRSARLDGVCLERANLERAQLEDVRVIGGNFEGALLSGAHLTGSRLPAAKFQKAVLRGARLAEIEWEGVDLRSADLRDATFHMGSSRSGLVGSPIACEGSRTGFYTDEREEAYFKRPEEIRKANLRGADLRGAKIDRVDFYLVDLRDARLDPSQLTAAQKSGAILHDHVA